MIIHIKAIAKWFERLPSIAQWIISLTAITLIISFGEDIRNSDALPELILTIVAAWAAIESMRLRILSAREISLLRKQVYGEVSPAISITIESWSATRDRLIQEIERAPGLTAEQLAAAQFEINAKQLRYTCRIDNLVESPAVHVHAIVYDIEHRSYVTSTEFEPFILRSDIHTQQSYLYINASHQTRESILQGLRDTYGQSCEFIFEHLTPERESYIAVLFSDVQGELYFFKQAFRMAGMYPSSYGRGLVFRNERQSEVGSDTTA